MKTKASGVCLALLAAGLCVASTAAVAQTSEIIVEAPRVERLAERNNQGTPVDLISVTHRVTYGDINVGTAAGAKTLEKRVSDAAKAACAEIDRLYPLTVPEPGAPRCEKKAFDKAMVAVRAAVAAAEKAGPN